MKKYTPYLLYLSASFMIIATMVTLKYASITNSLTTFESIWAKTTFAMILITPFQLKHFRKIKKEHLGLIFLTCAFGVFDAYVANISWSKLPVNNAILLMYLHPFIMTFFAWLMLGEKIQIKTIISMFICFFGVLIAVDFKSTNHLMFWYLALFVDLFVSSLGFIYLKKLTQFYPSSFIAYVRICAVSITSILMLKGNIPNINGQNIYLILILVFGYLYERISIAKAYSMIDVAKLQPLKFMNIAFSSILGYLILSEPVTKRQVISMAIIFIALGLPHVKIFKKSNHGE